MTQDSNTKKKVTGTAMKHLLTAIRACYTTVLVATIALSAYGCADSASISQDVAVPLSSLTVTPGSLQPSFFKNTTNYTVDAPTSATSVTVTAVPENTTDTMTINGVTTASGQGRSISLGAPGSTTTITIVVFSQTGNETTYTVIVTRLLSSDNNLSALSVTPGPLAPSFVATTLDYTVDVATTVASVTVSATKSDPSAVMLIESILISPITVPGGTASSGPVNIPLTGPGTSTVVSITITAPNGSQKTYQITVKRAASSNNNLSALSITPGSLNPPFAANRLSYTVDVATEITEVTVTATKSDPDAVMSGSVTAGTGVANGQATIPLNGAGTPTTVSITVTAPSGVSKTYVITVNRAASSDNNLSALSVTAGSVPLSLTPTFDRNHLDYTVEAPFGTLEVIVTATKSDPNAVMSGSVTAGAGIASGQATIFFTFLPPPQISITVTAPDGSFKIYKVTVNQAPPPPPFP